MTASEPLHDGRQILLGGMESLLALDSSVERLRRHYWSLKDVLGAGVLTDSLIAKAQSILASLREFGSQQGELSADVAGGLVMAKRPLIAAGMELLVEICLPAKSSNRQSFVAVAAIKVAAGAPSEIALLSAVAELVGQKWLPEVDMVCEALSTQQARWTRARLELEDLPDVQSKMKRRLENEYRLAHSRQRKTPACPQGKSPADTATGEP